MRTELEYAKRLEDFEAKSEKVAKALRVAEIAHEGEKRKSGEDYVNHSAAVASFSDKILALGDDEAAMSAALLHDVVENCTDVGTEKLAKMSNLVGHKVECIDLEFIREEFGEEVAFIVDGLTKFGDNAETIRKTILFTEENYRVIFIKLADRCTYFDTIEKMSEESRRANARETLAVYTRAAEKMGLWAIKNYLEDESFRQIDPERYWQVRNLIDQDPRLNRETIQEMKSGWEKWLIDHGFSGQVMVREKGYYEAMEARERLIDKNDCFHPEDFSDVTDLVSYRLILADLEQVKAVRMALEQEYQEVLFKSEFDDYITRESERGNGYSAYHEVLIIGGGKIEIAITTTQREDFNNWGLVSLLRRGERNLQKYMKTVFDEVEIG